MSEQPSADLFAAAVAKIEIAYRQLGHGMGWRFLATPRRTLSPEAPLAFITLNPGGSSINPAHAVASSEIGSAYVHECWKANIPGGSPLQRQVQLMFDWLGRDPNETLSACFVPFRSRSLQTLSSPEEAFAFAMNLRSGLLKKVRAPVGWGNYTARISRYDRRVLLRLPHFSIFKIFGRAASEKPLDAIRTELTRHCRDLGAE